MFVIGYLLVELILRTFANDSNKPLTLFEFCLQFNYFDAKKVTLNLDYFLDLLENNASIKLEQVYGKLKTTPQHIHFLYQNKQLVIT